MICYRDHVTAVIDRAVDLSAHGVFASTGSGDGEGSMCSVSETPYSVAARDIVVDKFYRSCLCSLLE